MNNNNMDNKTHKYWFVLQADKILLINLQDEYVTILYNAIKHVFIDNKVNLGNNIKRYAAIIKQADFQMLKNSVNTVDAIPILINFSFIESGRLNFSQFIDKLIQKQKNNAYRYMSEGLKKVANRWHLTKNLIIHDFRVIKDID